MHAKLFQILLSVFCFQIICRVNHAIDLQKIQRMEDREIQNLVLQTLLCYGVPKLCLGRAQMKFGLPSEREVNSPIHKKKGSFVGEKRIKSG